MTVRIIHSWVICFIAMFMWGACVYEDLGWLAPLDQWNPYFWAFYAGWIFLYSIPYWVIEQMSGSPLMTDLIILLPPIGIYIWATS